MSRARCSVGAVLLLAALAPGARAATFSPGIPGARSYRCAGRPVTLLDTSNTQATSNGGSRPTFSTGRRTYCLVSITSYHFNGGTGATPGVVGLAVLRGVGGTGQAIGPYPATGSAGQNGVPNANWSATIGTQPVIHGTYACTDSDPATWSQNGASHHRGFCTVVGVPATPTRAPRRATAIYTCSGQQRTLFDNSNGGIVNNGGIEPFFNTWGTPGVTSWCVNQLRTYHWNDGHGAKPGTLGLTPLFGAIQPHVPTQHALTSSGQGAAANVNWYVNFPGASNPAIISGFYFCADSDHRTWSSNQQTGGHGFCTVTATPAYVSGFTLPSGGVAAPTPAPASPPPAPTPKPGKPKCFTGTFSSMRMYPHQLPPGGSGYVLLHCGVKKADGFQGRLAPAHVFVIDQSCGPFWTAPSPFGNPPPPAFLSYTGPPTSPCMNAKTQVPFQVTGPWRIELTASDLTGAPLRAAIYAVYVEYAGGDAAPANTWIIQ